VDELRTIGSLAAAIQQRGDRLEKITCKMPDCRAPVYLIDTKFTLETSLRLIKYHLFAFHAARDQMLADISLEYSDRDAEDMRLVWIE
jgi:hypothetical protein